MSRRTAPATAATACALTLLVGCTSAPSSTSSGSRAGRSLSPSSIGSSTPTSTRPTSSAATAPSGSLTPTGEVEILDCLGGTPSSIPVTVVLTCGDGGREVDDIIWTSWTAAAASGTGTLTVNNCTPSCATGTLVRHPATIALSAPRAFDGVGLFTNVQVAATDGSHLDIAQSLPG